MFNTFTTNFPTISFVTHKMSDFENFNFMECSYNVHKYFLMIKYHYNDIILNTSIHTKNQLSCISATFGFMDILGARKVALRYLRFQRCHSRI